MGGSRPRNETAEGLIPPAVILGLGFTGQRVAKRLLLRGGDVFAFVRNPERFAALRSLGLHVLPFSATPPPGGLLLHTIPPLSGDDELQIMGAIGRSSPRRIVYISSTGVYGAEAEVDEKTAPAPSDERGRRRLEEEARFESGPWGCLVLRAAAIYGPGRGVHVAIREGRAPRGAGSGVVSRIHVDDLAAISEAGLYSDLAGSWPVADDCPCASAEIARFLMRGELPAGLPVIEISGRKVDGRAARNRLGTPLAYPDWRSGILASIAEERAARIRRPTG